ncbi:MAG: hypothetical protein DRI34_03120 [Deltaproteobacteria bacterium]|nr:MAG: hypothetical protein DRI34_03120 [Deltaproteobacteria bacterium]
MKTTPRPQTCLAAALLLLLNACTGTIYLPSGDGGQDADAAVLPDGSDESADGDTSPGDQPADNGDQSGGDSDGDGLPDSWEVSAGNPDLLDPHSPDSNANGVPDAAEDYDGDGLTNIQEYAAGRLSFLGDISPPHPLRRDLLVELDCMTDRCLSAAQLADAAAAWADVMLDNPDGSAGVGLHVVLDETGLTPQRFDGSFEQRWNYFAAHGPHFDDGGSPPLPLDRFVHVLVVQIRDDLPDRGGDTVAGPGGQRERAGVFIYHDVIYNLFPACGRTSPPLWPEITPEEMATSTFVHELGHTLQLGHDTEVGGGVNPYNVMAVPQSCVEAQMRTHGVDNDDPTLGATAQVGAARFSAAAAALMDFENILSVDTDALEPTEM